MLLPTLTFAGSKFRMFGSNVVLNASVCADLLLVVYAYADK